MAKSYDEMTREDWLHKLGRAQMPKFYDEIIRKLSEFDYKSLYMNGWRPPEKRCPRCDNQMSSYVCGDGFTKWFCASCGRESIEYHRPTLPASEA